MTQPDPLGAAIQAGKQALDEWDNKAFPIHYDYAKAVIDAAIASGELVPAADMNRLWDAHLAVKQRAHDAAAEVERLRNENEQLRERHEGCQQLLADHNRYRDEIKRLRKEAT